MMREHISKSETIASQAAAGDFQTRLQALRGKRKPQNYALPPVDLRKHLKKEAGHSVNNAPESPVLNQRIQGHKEQLDWIKDYYLNRLSQDH